MHCVPSRKPARTSSCKTLLGLIKKGHEITLIDILGSKDNDVINTVQFKIEKKKTYCNLDILDDLKKELAIGR